MTYQRGARVNKPRWLRRNDPGPEKPPLILADVAFSGEYADLLNVPVVGELSSHTVATLPSPSPAGRMIYVSDETGGAVVAFSDGTNWRRVTDRVIVS